MSRRLLTAIRSSEIGWFIAAVGSPNIVYLSSVTVTSVIMLVIASLAFGVWADEILEAIDDG